MIIPSHGQHYRAGLVLGTPTLGLVRVEWVRARYAQAMPVNWAMAEVMPKGFLVDEAQNIIVRETLAGGYEWLLLLEDDVILPPFAFKRINEYMTGGKYPVVSGLYFTKSHDQPEPLIFRGRGNGAFHDFEIGEPVWCDGVPTGCLLIHASVLVAMADAAPEVTFGESEQTARQVFATVRDEEHDSFKETRTVYRTSDLQWCDDVLAGGYLDGWKLPHPEFPFLVDTSLFCLHIDKDGRTYPKMVEREAA